MLAYSLKCVSAAASIAVDWSSPLILRLEVAKFFNKCSNPTHRGFKVELVDLHISVLSQKQPQHYRSAAVNISGS